MTSGKKWLFWAGTVFLATSAALLAGELLARLLWRSGLPSDRSERTLAYRYDSQFGWFPIPNSETRIEGSRWFHIRHNQDGFRDAAHGPKTKPRLAFVGDSFVWGFDVEQEERFTDRLQPLLPDWEILNLGVSGYATDQELLLLERWFGHYQPDVVVLVFCDNDLNENVTNSVHGGYYKPYFEKTGSDLVQRGVPVPKSVHYYRQEHPLVFGSRLVQFIVYLWVNWRSPKVGCAPDPTLYLLVRMKQFVESRGAKFVLGFCTDVQADKKLAFCQACKVDHLFLLDSSLRTHDHEYVFPSFSNHWTPKGHQQVCLALRDYLTTNHVLTRANLPTPAPH